MTGVVVVAEGEGGSGVSGVAEIAFAARDGATRLSHLYQRHPMRVLFPAPEAGISVWRC